MDYIFECADVFGECPFLKETDHELQKRQQLSSMKLRATSKKFDVLFQLAFKFLNLSEASGIQNAHIHILTKLTRDKEALAPIIKELESDCNSLSKEWQELPQQVAQKEDISQNLAENLQQLKIEADNIMQDSKQQQQLFKQTLEATKIAKLHYKDLLGCHVSMVSRDEDNAEFIFSYSKIRPSPLVPLPLNSIQCLLNRSKKTWKLVETNPSVKNFKQLALKLDKSQDIQGLLVHLRPTMNTIQNVH